MDLESKLREILPKAQHKKIDLIIEAIEGSFTVDAVATLKAHAAVETVQAYGLTIGVDATGYAATVAFPYGAEVSAW